MSLETLAWPWDFWAFEEADWVSLMKVFSFCSMSFSDLLDGDLKEAMEVGDHNMVTSTFSLAGIWSYQGRGQHLCSLKETL